MRGEHYTARTKWEFATGSAPRARGTPLSDPAVLPSDRISPACAGNTTAPCSRRRRSTDQPRVRGEHGRGAPDARGGRGISPACAGNTSCRQTRCRDIPDQPRVRGEHALAGLVLQASYGSAPRARGTPRRAVRVIPGRRISPACAGNTRPQMARRCSCTDQPRVRGEHSPYSVRVRSSIGSAPRARGTPGRGAARVQPCRISPACAGNTLMRAVRPSPISDQPRVRGEHPIPEPLFLPPTRISPACAGNTGYTNQGLRGGADQPRVRGEHLVGQLAAIDVGGSAPRARGTQTDAPALGVVCRISPACAGNTFGRVIASTEKPDQPRVRGEHGSIWNP